MKQLKLTIILLLMIVGLNAQQTDPFYGDVYIYGNIKIFNNPGSTNLDSTLIPYLFVDSMSIGGVKLDSLQMAKLISGVSLSADTGYFNVINTLSSGNITMPTDVLVENKITAKTAKIDLLNIDGYFNGMDSVARLHYTDGTYGGIEAKYTQDGSGFYSRLLLEAASTSLRSNIGSGETELTVTASGNYVNIVADSTMTGGKMKAGSFEAPTVTSKDSMKIQNTWFTADDFGGNSSGAVNEIQISNGTGGFTSAPVLTPSSTVQSDGTYLYMADGSNNTFYWLGSEGLDLSNNTDNNFLFADTKDNGVFGWDNNKVSESANASFGMNHLRFDIQNTNTTYGNYSFFLANRSAIGDGGGMFIDNEDAVNNNYWKLLIPTESNRYFEFYMNNDANLIDRFKLDTTSFLVELNNDTVFKIEKDSTVSFNDLKVNGNIDADTANVAAISVGGSTPADTTYSSQYVIENTEVNKIEFDTSKQPVSEGTMYYDKWDKTISFYDDIGIKKQMQRGICVRFYNNTGSTLIKGTLVTSSGGKVNGSITFTAQLAGIGSLDSLNGVAMVIKDVLDGEFGEAMLIGQVDFLNTSMYVDNQPLWVGYHGTLSDTSPNAPDYAQLFCKVIYADDDSGAVFIDGLSSASFNPSPTFSASFSGASEIIENPGQNIYALITNATNDLYIQQRNIGFMFQGDSISPMQDGNYTVFYSYSQLGEASQTDVYRTGCFIDGELQYYMPRTISGTNLGGVPFPTARFISAGSWISFRTANRVTGTRNCTFENATITINYSSSEQ